MCTRSSADNLNSTNGWTRSSASDNLTALDTGRSSRRVGSSRARQEMVGPHRLERETLTAGGKGVLDVNRRQSDTRAPQ